MNIWGEIIGVTIGVVIGVLLAVGVLYCFLLRRRHRRHLTSSASRGMSTAPMCVNGIESSSVLSDSTMDKESPKYSVDLEADGGHSFWLDGTKRKNLVSASGVPNYSYKDLQKATHNFTSLIGRGAYGSVYKAQMPTGETVAVKVLVANSKQGEKEFQTEVLLLGRLHHRNLVNLVGYCADKGQHILIYVYMTNGSVASHLYGANSVSFIVLLTVFMDCSR